MGHLPLNLQTATSGRLGERYFVGIAHDFNSGIRLYCPINKTTITRHSYKFLDTNTPNAPVYVISDPTVALNISLPDDSLSSDSFSTSPEEVRPTLSQEVGPTLSQEVGPTLLHGAYYDAFDSSRSVSLSQSMSSYIDTIQLNAHDYDNWTHLPLPYAHAPKLVKPHYDSIGRLFTERGSTNQYAIVDIVTSSAPKFQNQICFKF